MNSGIRAIQVWGLAAFLAVSVVRPQPARAIELNAGASIGFQVPSSGFAAGTSLFSSLFAEAILGKWFGLGVSYGEGQSLTKTAEGTAPDYAGWTLSGFEIQASYRHDREKVKPYAALGIGRYRIKLRSSETDSRLSVSVIGGVRAVLSQVFFGLIELRYSVLSFSPGTSRIDLDGFRVSLGLGLALEI